MSLARLLTLMCCAMVTLVAVAQDKPTVSAASEKPRAFITDSQSWEIAGGGGGSSSGFGGAVKGGARPQTAEIIKTFGERCPQVVINNKQDKADYIVLLDHEGGKGFIRKDNKVAVFNKDGDSIVSHSTSSLGSAVKDACEAINKDWPASAAKLRAPAPAPATPALIPAAATTTSEASGKISVSSNPPSADIEIDGSFVGTTPSAVEVTPGEHDIVVKKAGFQTWQRKMKVMNGSISVNAELEKTQ
jgi:hypothetical protein